MYCVVRPTMVVMVESVLNMYRLFFLSLSLKQCSITTIYVAFTLL